MDKAGRYGKVVDDVIGEALASLQKRNGGGGGDEPFRRKVKRGGDFIKEYEPLGYAVEGILPEGMLCALTAKRSAGKTAFLQSLTLTKITGRSDIIGFEADPGRVAYIALENPTDFRMKLAVNAYVHGIDLETLNDNLAIIDARLPLKEIVEQLRVDTEEYGPFGLIPYDTFQAGFTGGDFNNNKEILAHAMDLRELTELPGRPAVVPACHPVKNPTRDNLEPYGGGSSLNEFDANLTLWAQDGRIELGWTKLRGPEFEPKYFRIEKLGSPDIRDNKGRTPLLPVMRPMSAVSVIASEKVSVDLDKTLLIAMADDPGGTIEDWGNKIGRKKSSVGDRLKKLHGLKLVEQHLGDKWRLTKKGKAEAELAREGIKASASYTS